MRIALVGLLVVMGLFGGALLRTEAVLACPARTTPHFPSTSFGVFAAYDALDQATKSDQVRALATYFYDNCAGAEGGSVESPMVRGADNLALMAVSPFVSFDAAFLVIELQSRP